MSRIVVFIILTVGLIFSVYLVSQKTSLFSKASVGISPKNITISNISDNSLTVSYVTDKEDIGIVKYSQSYAFENSAYDERDQGGSPKLRNTHYVILKG